MTEQNKLKMKTEELKIKPGVRILWKENLKELPQISGDKQLCQRVWEGIDAQAYTYIWHCLLSF